jgi:phage-related protein
MAVTGEVLKQKYQQLLNEHADITQRNLALLEDKNDLNKANNAAQARIEVLLNQIDQLNETNEKLTEKNEKLIQSNESLKIVLRDAEDERDFYKASNFKEFDKFIESYIFGLFRFDIFNFNNPLINQILTVIQAVNILDNQYTRIIFKKFLRPVFIILYSHVVDHRKLRITEIIFINLIVVYSTIYVINLAANYSFVCIRYQK